MKFSSALKFNAVADWWDEYIAYDVLKRHIFQLEKEHHRLSHVHIDLEATERTALVGQSDLSKLDSVFIPLLDQELHKISTFYQQKEKELFEDLTALEELVEQQDQAGPEAGQHYMDDYVDDDDDEEEEEEDLMRDHVHFEGEPIPKRRRRKSSSVSIGRRNPSATRRSTHRLSISSLDRDMDGRASSSRPRANSASMSPVERARDIADRLMNMRDSITSLPTESVWTARTNYAWDVRLLFKRRITNLYVSFSALKSYVEVNYSGFRKILKKYDKLTFNELQGRYMHEAVDNGFPFLQDSRDRIAAAIDRLVTLYAKCVTGDDPVAAVQQLKVHQREHIAWERNTVWRQMLAQERRGDGGSDTMGGAILVRDEETGLVNVPTPLGGFRFKRKKIFLVIAIAVFALLMNTTVIKDGPEANKCFAILIFSTIMWASEAIPLFVTSMLVPFLLVIFQVVRGEDEAPLPTPAATKYVFSVMFSPTIMLLVGGLTISAALSKTNIDRMLITRMLSMAGSKPRTVLLAFMGVSCFASMWISNVAAPALCFTLIRPILRTLPARASFAPCLILGIALAANIGGQSSPISSPQNLIAVSYMDPKLDWGSWFAVSLPVSIISILLIWLLLIVSYNPSHSPDGSGPLEIRAIRPTRETFTLKQYWVTLVCFITIFLWCIEQHIEPYVGDMGIIAIIPIVAFFATGVLKKDDFEQFAWTIVFLAMGGVALGNGVKSSGLMATMDDGIRKALEGRGFYSVVMVLSVVVLVVSTFISHTIASVLLVPIAKEVGKNFPGPQGDRSNLLIFLTGLICSTGMGMPVSGFPNQLANAQEDDLGQTYLSNVDFLKNGVPASIIATLVVSTVGYLLMEWINL